jgi:hypothetical protein
LFSMSCWVRFVFFAAPQPIPNRLSGSETTSRVLPVACLNIQLSRNERPELLHRDGLNRNSVVPSSQPIVHHGKSDI